MRTIVSIYRTPMRYAAAVTTMAVILWGVLQGTAAASPGGFDTLAARLISDGFDAARISRIYQSPDLTFDVRGVSLYFMHQEGRLNYGQFLEEEALRKARVYLDTHREIMTAAEQGFGVDRHVIAAILLVETHLGAYVGTRRVINTLSTLAALSDPQVREWLWQSLAQKTHLSRMEFDARADEKSRWAYTELKAFLSFIQKEGIAPFSVPGSYAGAMGYCQFIPSKALELAMDGDGDGRVNLFSHADAIMSIARYLAHFGWHSAIPESSAYRVVYEYNHSAPYVNTVLTIAKTLRTLRWTP